MSPPRMDQVSIFGSCGHLTEVSTSGQLRLRGSYLYQPQKYFRLYHNVEIHNLQMLDDSHDMEILSWYQLQF